MMEVYSEVRAVLSPHVTDYIHGNIEEIFASEVKTANLEKVIGENDIQFLLRGTLEGIVTAQNSIIDLLKDLSTKEDVDVCLEEAINGEDNHPSDKKELQDTHLPLQTDLSVTPEQGIHVNNLNSNILSTVNSTECNKIQLRKSKRTLKRTFHLKDKFRTKQRGKTSRRLFKKIQCSNSSIKSVKNKENSHEIQNTDLTTAPNNNSDAEIQEGTIHTTIFEKSVDGEKKNYEISPFKHFCELCSFKTRRISHFTKHMAIHEKVNTLYKCSQCSFTSVRLSHLRRHEMAHSSTVHKCTQCHYTTDDKKFLMRHIRLKHRGSCKDKKSSTTLDCPQCPYKTTKQYYYDRHQRMHTSNSQSCLHQCEQCCYKTHRKEHFVRHVNNVHGNKRPYLCHLCGKAFKRGDALQQHHQTHAETKITEGINFKCEVCEKSFRTQSHLQEHQAVHSEIRSFLCEICGASFKTRSVQRKHVLTIHRNPRAYSCEACKKRFNTLYALKRHQKIHDGKSPQTKESEVETVHKLNTPEESIAPELKSVHVGTTTHGITIPTVTTLQMACSSDSLSIDSRPVPLQETAQTVGSNAKVIQHLTPAFLQPSETTTALLYLTNGFATF